MYVLDQQAIRSVDTKGIVPFIECWERYYDYANDDNRVYFAEINLDREVTPQNITRLLRWKDRRWLTHPKKADGEPNPRVIRVLDQLGSINGFRNGGLTADEFHAVTQNVFPNGMIWQLFLFHIARPSEWPIADQHVFRSYSLLFKAPAPDSVAAYRSYAKAFRQLTETFRQSAAIQDNTSLDIVKTNKRVDNALFAFGQFLAKYVR